MSSTDILKFSNCRILRNHRVIDDSLWVRNGIIIDPEKLFFEERIKPKFEYDMKGCLLAPGFIEIQINGGYGIDFSHNDANVEEGLDTVAVGILSHGVTSFCPTVVTSTPEVYKKVLPKLKKRRGSKNGAEVLGVHIEGPFINLDKKGAHSADNIKDFTEGVKTVLEVYGSLDNVKIITLAPEKTNAVEVIDYMISKNINVSLGHSLADFEKGVEAVHHGANLITHLFNAMLPFHHRDPGLVGLLAADNGYPIFYGIIADGVHTHPSALRIAYRTHPKGVILVTDAISAMGLLEGTHHVGDKAIQIRDNHAYIADTNTLCGSVATMNACVKFFMEASGCSLVEALEAASLHPAMALGIDKTKGTFAFGADADFVCLDENLTVLSTWIAGDCVYRSC